jgi:hypothetical protein
MLSCRPVYLENIAARHFVWLIDAPQRGVSSRLQALPFAYCHSECGLETCMGVDMGLKLQNNAGAGLKFYQNVGF